MAIKNRTHESRIKALEDARCAHVGCFREIQEWQDIAQSHFNELYKRRLPWWKKVKWQFWK